MKMLPGNISPIIDNPNKQSEYADKHRILNMIELDKIDKNTKIIYEPSAERNILNIPEWYKIFEIVIKFAVDTDIQLKSPIPPNCKFIFEYYAHDDIFFKPLEYKTKLINFLKLLPIDTYSIDLSSILSKTIQQDITQYFPKNLKKYHTYTEYRVSIDNLPQSLEILSLYPANQDYTYLFLPLTLHTLEIKNYDYQNANIILPELAHLPLGLKVLSLDSYTHSLASLPEGLEKLLITNYHCSDENIEFYMLPNLKTFQICKWVDNYKIHNVKEYPASLEHLDIDCHIDIGKLPPTLKSLGLYYYDLSSTVIDIPMNITTIYTEDDFIKQLPAHIKRVIITIKHPGGTGDSKVCVGDVIFEINSYNTDECFNVF